MVADESALAQGLLSANAGIAFIDAGALGARPGVAEQLILRLHNQLPDVVLVVAGDGAAQAELAALVTDGTIYRYVHKPVSAQRVKLFVDAAWRKRDGLSSASGLFPALPMAQLTLIEPMRRPVPWPAIGAAVVVTGAGIAWYMLRTNSDSGPQPPMPSAATVTAQAVAPPAVAPVAHARHEPRPPAASVDLEHVETVIVRPRASARRRAVEAAAPTPAKPDTVRAATPAAAVALTPTISSSPEMVSPPSSTPPASEARDPLSVAAIILQREYAPDPEFPEIAREQDLSGFVDLEFTVNPDGSVADVTVLKSQPAGVFDKSAVSAVGQWRYRPISRDGVPVSEHARLRLNFAYKQNPTP